MILIFSLQFNRQDFFFSIVCNKYFFIHPWLINFAIIIFLQSKELNYYTIGIEVYFLKISILHFENFLIPN